MIYKKLIFLFKKIQLQLQKYNYIPYRIFLLLYLDGIINMSYSTHQLNQVISIEINEDYYCEVSKYTGSYGEYYKFNGIYYDIHFPIDWVFQTPSFVSNENIVFGPETCFNCFECGYYNGVFIGYCVSCARLINYERGNGLIGNGIENQGNEQKSIWNVYLQNTALEEIGDHDLCIDYHYKLHQSDIIPDYNNDTNTITYDSLGYISSSSEDDITIAFSSFTEISHNITDSYSSEYSDDDYLSDIDSIS